MRKMFVAAAVLAVSLSMPSVAQNVMGRPSFGTLNLRSGFLPDPRVVPVTAGGRLDASSLGGSNCLGSIANAPDVRVNYQAGSLPLNFYVTSNEDTTLVINGPDGQWYCNDDTNGLNPAVVFANPGSGQYDVYIGHYGQGAGVPARLHVSEVRSQ